MNLANSRAVLIGTSYYTELDQVPAAAHSLESIRALLTDPLCGWPADRVTTILNRPRPGDLPFDLIKAFEDADDVALFYYVGHAQVDNEDKLCLGLVDSEKKPEHMAATSLTFDAVRAALRASNAKTKIVILDCCYAGQAVDGQAPLSGDDTIVNRTRGTGAYILAASGPYSRAWFDVTSDDGRPLTHFTRYFVQTIQRGIPDEPSELTLDRIYLHVRDEMADAGKSTPTNVSRDEAANFPFARNVAPRTTHRQPDEPPVGDRSYRTELLDEAERAAREIPDIPDRLAALLAIASDDPARARRLADEADHGRRQLAAAEQLILLPSIAGLVISADPSRARRLLAEYDKLLTSSYAEAKRGEVVVASSWEAGLLALDPDLAQRLGNTIRDYSQQRAFLANLVRAVARRDLDRAERIARRQPSPRLQAPLLTEIVETVLASDPDRAERVARSIQSVPERSRGLTRVAISLALSDEHRARQLLSDATSFDSSLAIVSDRSREAIATTIVTADLQAVDWLYSIGIEMVEGISEPSLATETALALAGVLLPGRSADAIAMLERVLGRLRRWSEPEADQLLAAIDAIDVGGDLPRSPDDAVVGHLVTTAGDDPARAELLAHDIPERVARARGLVEVAGALADRDPESAAQLTTFALRSVRFVDAEYLDVLARVASYDVDRVLDVIDTTTIDAATLDPALQKIGMVVADDDVDLARDVVSRVAGPIIRYAALLELAGKPPTSVHVSSGRSVASPEFDKVRSLAGRDAELSALDAAFADPAPRQPVVAVLRGVFQAGKFFIAGGYGNNHRDDYSLMLWVNAEHVADIPDQFRKLAELLDPRRAGAPDPVAVVHRALARRRDRWLLVLYRVADLEAAQALLPTAGHGNVIIVSESKDWPGYTTIRVGDPAKVAPRPSPGTLLAGSLRAGHQEVFRLDDTGQLWHRWTNVPPPLDARTRPVWSDWTTMESPTPLRQIVGFSGDNYQELVAVTKDGSLIRRWFRDDSALWRPWSPMASPGKVVVATSGSQLVNESDLYVVLADGRLFVRRVPFGSLNSRSNWDHLPCDIGITALARVRGQLFAATPRGDIYRQSAESNSWRKLDAPGDIRVLVPFQGKLYAVLRDGLLFLAAPGSGRLTWYPVPTPESVVAVARSSLAQGHSEMFIRTTSGRFFRQWHWQGSEQSEWELFDGPAAV